MKLSALTLEDSDEWREWLTAFPVESGNVFLSPEYLRTWTEIEPDAMAFCLIGDAEGTRFAYPFVRRPVSPGGEGAIGSDIQSAYGYGGVLADRPEPTDGALDAFNSSVDSWCMEHSVIAEFVREFPGHPPLRDAKRMHVRDSLFHDYGPAGTPLLEQLTARARRDVRSSLRKGVKSQVSEGPQDIAAFGFFYREFCDKREFDASYHFEQAYFDLVAESQGLRPFTVSIVLDGTAISQALCFGAGNTVVYHLSASLPEHRHLLPNDLLLHAILEHGRALGSKRAFLGGGLTTSQDDSLFRFKKKYATRAEPTFIATKVHDQESYDRLCAEWRTSNPERSSAVGNFFLLYRL